MREYDLVIRGGTVIDGTGVPRRQADVAVKDGRVAMISGNIPAGAAKEINASGCFVAPGQSTCTLTMTPSSTGTRTPLCPGGSG